MTTTQASNLYAFAVPGNLPGFYGRSDTTQHAPNRLYVPESNHTERSFKSESDDGTRRPAALHRFVSEAALDQVRKIAPGWDRQALLRKFMDWPGSKEARDMDKAFLAWVKRWPRHTVASRRAVSRASSSCARTSRRDATGCRLSGSRAPHPSRPHQRLKRPASASSSLPAAHSMCPLASRRSHAGAALPHTGQGGLAASCD
jgi:hypothetical protein